jgi:fermentation-respiration switch protein FrsA (DUF1100 family)
MRTAVIASILTAVLLYGAGVGMLALFQRRLLYFPDTRRPDLSRVAVPGATVMTVRTSDQLDLLAWFAAPQDPSQPVVLYLHGNGGNIASRATRMARLNSFGWGVLLIDYRGYGGNPGAPSEQGLIEDARAGYAALRAMGVPGHRILLWGESLGSGVAVRLAGEAEVGAVLLESPFTSIAALARQRFAFVPVDLLLRDRFELLSRIGTVRAPVLIMAGGKDAVVPPAMGRAVFAAAAEPKSYWLAPDAGHNDLRDAGALEAAKAFVSARWRAAP